MFVVSTQPGDQHRLTIDRCVNEVIHRRRSRRNVLRELPRPVEIEPHPHHNRIDSPFGDMGLGQDPPKFSVDKWPTDHDKVVGPFQARLDPSDLNDCLTSCQTARQGQKEEVLGATARPKQGGDQQ
jgi:hypothetical protein